MKRASVTEAKNKLRALLDRVKHGASFLIVDRGRPVARLEPVDAQLAGDDDRLAQLVRDGVIRPAREAASKGVLAASPPRARKGASAVRALLEERRGGLR